MPFFSQRLRREGERTNKEGVDATKTRALSNVIMRVMWLEDIGGHDWPADRGRDHPGEKKKAKKAAHPLEPRPYGMADSEDTKEKALVMFSGRARAGDLVHQVSERGWMVCAIDLLFFFLVSPRSASSAIGRQKCTG